MKHPVFVLISLGAVFSVLACKKSEYLSAKPNAALVVPASLKDYQSILDNTGFMNGFGIGVIPALGEAASDNYYVVDDGFTGAISTIFKNLYVWDDGIWDPTLNFEDWSFSYRTVFYSNVVLDGLDKVAPFDPINYNNIKGSALFFRAHSFYQLAQIFAAPYDSTTADISPGIVLKTSSDINEKAYRSTLRATYDKIASDLEDASKLLPELPLDGIKTRPSKVAALSLLARLNLSMRKYDMALEYASAALSIYDELMDYNDNLWVDTVGSIGLRAKFNPEVIFSSNLIVTNINYLLFNNGIARIDSVLYKSYLPDDLRRLVFFRSVSDGEVFKGSYDASNVLFGGIATDEIYLIRAECNARLGNVSAALKDLNALLRTRWNSSATYTPVTAIDATDALKKVLEERRKELIFRGLRWTDLRRLNLEGRNITLKRNVDGDVYILDANSPHYTFLIPPSVISFNADMSQNIR